MCISENNPKVSIVIPVYNGANFMGEAIDSALNQTYKNCEIIVVNDGSNDNGATERVALSYGDKIRYFSKENGGVSTALNVGIRNMEGEYFSWLSHDDLYAPDKIEKEIEAILASGDKTALAFCNYYYLNQDTGELSATDFHKYYTTEQLTNSVFLPMYAQAHMCGGLIHKSHFERVGLLDESLRYSQDWEIEFRVCRGQKIVFVPESLFTVRVHGQEVQRLKRAECDEEVHSISHSLIDEMSLEEMRTVFGAPEIVITRALSYGSPQQNAKALENYKVLIGEANTADLEKAQAYIQSLGENNIKRVMVYGAGIWGRAICFELQHRNIEVECFIDSNPQKWNTVINGVECKCVDDVIDKKNETLVVVAMRERRVVINKLQELGFPYIVTNLELLGEFSKLIPVL